MTDFPAKVDQWTSQQLTEKQIQEKLVKSVTSMYWSAARRDPRTFEQEIKAVLLPTLKTLPSIGPRLDGGELTPTDLAITINQALERADLGRAPVEVKDLIHDLFVYAALFYFVKKGKRDQLGNIQLLRDEITHVTQALLGLPVFRRIFFQVLTSITQKQARI